MSFFGFKFFSKTVFAFQIIYFHLPEVLKNVVGKRDHRGFRLERCKYRSTQATLHLLLFGVKVGLALINGYSRQQPRQSNTFTLLLYFATFQVPRKMLIEAVLVLSRPGSAGVSQRAVEGCVTIRLSAPSFSFTFFYYLSCVFNIVCSPCPSSHTSTTSRVCSRYLGSAYSHARVGLALKQVKIKYSHLFLLACLHPPFPFFSFPPPPPY